MSDNRITGPGYYPKRPDRLRPPANLRQSAMPMNFGMPYPGSYVVADAHDTRVFAQAIGRHQAVMRERLEADLGSLIYTSSTTAGIRAHLVSAVLGLRECTVTCCGDEIVARVIETDFEDRHSEDLVLRDMRTELAHCVPAGTRWRVEMATPVQYLWAARHAATAVAHHGGPEESFERMLHALRAAQAPQEILDTFDLVVYETRSDEISCTYHDRPYFMSMP